MTPAQLLAYLGPAFLYAALGTAVFWLLWWGAERQLGRGQRVGGRHALTLFLALFFLVLTQYPLPDRATLDCTSGGAPPILRPFATFDHVMRLWHWSQNDPGIGPGAWFGSRVIQAAVMNFVLCAAIGAAYARHADQRRPWRGALGLGLFLSCGAELAQVTGLFGLYPCAWRTFETDDLILNIGGLMTGFLVTRRWCLPKKLIGKDV